MAYAMESAFPAGIMRYRKKPGKNAQDFGVETGAIGFFRFAINRKDIPPHIAGAIKWVSWLLIEVREMGGASNGHDLLEERHERAQRTKTRRQGNFRLDKREHEIRATIADEVPEPLIELRVSESSEQLASVLERLGDECGNLFRTAVPIGRVG